MKVLFVCLGNICRSPTAEGVFRHIVDSEGFSDHFVIDSAGTSAWHKGNDPDSRSTYYASLRGYELKGSSRPVLNSDYEDFDVILAMDSRNDFDLRKDAPKHLHYKIKMITDYCKLHLPERYPEGVPDPYKEGEDGFKLVLDLLEDSCTELFKELTSKDLKANGDKNISTQAKEEKKDV